MRYFLLLLLALGVAAGPARAQHLALAEPPETGALEALELVRYAGLSENIFDALLETSRSASFHYGSAYDVTYHLQSFGMLTVQFFEGRAGFFRLITTDGQPSAGDLLWLLGIDTDRLALVENRDVKKVWSGYLDDLGLQEVTAINDDGWKVATVKVAGYPHR